jgi:ABC-type transporter lipoprotein component MlaA
VIGSQESFKGSSLRADCGPVSMTWIQLGCIRPRKDGLTQRNDDLGQGLGRWGVAWPARKDGVAHHNLAVDLQADTAWSVSWYVNERHPSLPDLHLHAIYQRKVRLQAKSVRIGRMDAYGKVKRLPYCLQCANMIGVTVR